MIETERLILRPWLKDDILPFSAINSDEEVMEYLPKCLSLEETVQFYNRFLFPPHKVRSQTYHARQLYDYKTAPFLPKKDIWADIP